LGAVVALAIIKVLVPPPKSLVSLMHCNWFVVWIASSLGAPWHCSDTLWLPSWVVQDTPVGVVRQS